MALCSSCRSISFTPPEPRDHKYFPYATSATLQPNAEALQKSALTCICCAKFWDALSHYGRSPTVLPILEAGTEEALASDRKATPEDLRVILRGCLETPDNSGLLNHYVCIEYKHWSSECRPEQPISQQFQDLLGQLTIDQASTQELADLDAYTGSEVNLRLATHWLQDCLHTHKNCAPLHVPQTTPVLPSRVVDVSNPSKPRLFETRGKRDNYLTLSYCWGEGKRLLTTSQSYAIYQRGLPTDDRLPATFRDAFKVTKALGYNYIWIDALCILQDDQFDMHQEMENMGDIYQKSAVTIFGSNGGTTDSGLFMSRTRPSCKPCNVVIRTIEDGKPQKTKVAFFSDHYEKIVDPLSQRGWVLQEQVLAQRQLVFTPREIRWTCKTSSLSETRPAMEMRHSSATLRPDDAILPTGPLNEVRLMVSQPDLYKTLSYVKLDIGEIYDTWYDAVRHYSSRNLSVPVDKLPAIAGIAQIMHNHFGCQYGAGVWKEDLARGLCWATEIHSDDANDTVAAEKKKSYETEEYIAPSWSWASIRGRGVRWEQKALRLGRGKAAEEAEVLDWTFTHPSDAVIPFGRVSSGTLRLRGYFRELLLVASPWVSAHNWFFQARETATASVVGKITLDSPRTRQELLKDYKGEEDLSDCRTLPEAGIPVSTLTTFVSETSRHRHIHALVVVAVDSIELQYQRVGMLYAQEPLETTSNRRANPTYVVEKGSWAFDEKQGHRKTIQII